MISLWLGPELWLLVAWLAFRRQWLQLGAWLGLPLFYMLGSWGFGRGLSPYRVGHIVGHLRGPHQPATRMGWPSDAEFPRVV